MVSLTYEYGGAHVWLDELLPERDPHAYDLCAGHARRLSVPAGWRLSDRRVSSARGLKWQLIAAP